MANNDSFFENIDTLKAENENFYRKKYAYILLFNTKRVTLQKLLKQNSNEEIFYSYSNTSAIYHST